MESHSNMASKVRTKISESIFGVFYVMTEGDFPSGGTRKFCFVMSLLLLDALQVLRSLAVSNFLWTGTSISIMRSIDLVSLFFSTVQRVIPEWVFFSMAVILAIGAILNATWVMKLFRAGHVKIIWPLKILRFMVSSIVTVFFTTVLEFLIYPVRCIDVGEHHLSSVLHDGSGHCDPWAMPEMAFSIPTIFVAIAFISFSLLTTFLDFTINPLCRHPLSQCTGRLESLWTLFKVAALLLVYLSPFISATCVAVLLFLLSVTIFVYHITVLPFHSPTVNMVRGGIYLAAVAFCLGALVNLHHPNNQPLQNWLLAGVCAAFIAGMAIVHQINNAVLGYLSVLRGQWDEKVRAEAASHHHGHARGRRASLVSECTQQTAQIAERSMHEQFFDIKWEAQRRFTSGSTAYLATRLLLHQRLQDDMPFLLSLLSQCLKDHPSNNSLAMFHLLVLRFVFKERSQALAQERLSKMNSTVSVALDRSYILFAVNKKAVQESASEGLGKGSISAVNLMEFDQRMEVAQKSHRECIVSMKAFWKNVAKKRRAKTHDAVDKANKMTEELERFNKAMCQARQEYAWLYEKYPSSVALLHAYASFCDHVLNETKKADQLRAQVASLENYTKGDDYGMEETIGEVEDEELNAFAGATGGGGDNKSVSTDSEPYRVQMARYMQSWSHIIMSRDTEMLKALNWRVKCAIFFLVALSLASFIVNDFVLFNDVALKTIEDIEETGVFRELTATAPYKIRQQWIEVQEHPVHMGDFNDVTQTINDITEEMQNDHYHTYEEITTDAIRNFYEEPNLPVLIPTPTGWEEATQSFRQLGSDFARRVASAASGTVEEIQDTNFHLDKVSQEKRDTMYLFENMIRYILPSFDKAVGIYEHQMDEFGHLTTVLTAVSAALTSLVVLTIAVNVLRARTKLLQRVHANRVSISLALEIPRCVAVHFYKYFSDLELDMAMMQDAEEQDLRQHLVDADNEVRSTTKFGRRPSGNSVDSGSDYNKRALDRARSSSVPNALEISTSKDMVALDDSMVGSTQRKLRSPMGHARRVSADDALGKEGLTLTADNLQLLMEATKAEERMPAELEPIGIPPLHNDEDDEDDDAGGAEQEASGSASEGGEEEGEGEEEENESSSEGGSSSGSGEFEVPEDALANHRQASLVFVHSIRRGVRTLHEGAAPAILRQALEGWHEWAERRKNKALATEAGFEEGPASPLGPARSPPPPKKRKGKATKMSKRPIGSPGPRKKSNDDALQASSSPDVGSSPSVPRRPSIKKGARRASDTSAGVVEVEDVKLVQGQDGLSPASGVFGNGNGDGPERLPSILSLERVPSAGEDSTMSKAKSLRFSSSAKDLKKDPEPEKGGVAGVFAAFQGKKVKDKKKKLKDDDDDDDEDAKSAKMLNQDSLALLDIPQEMQDALDSLQHKGLPWYNLWYVYWSALAILLALCMMFTLYPARHIPMIINMAPSTDHASERISLAQQCIFLARELVLDDGFSRMTKAEISGTLQAFLERYEDVDKAVRIGSPPHGIISGADHRLTAHNELMYKVGCPWREDPTNCYLPNSTYTRAAQDGLFNLQSAFLDSAKTILRKHGTTPDEYINIYGLERPPDEDISAFEDVVAGPNFEIVETDIDLVFLDMMFEGDLFQGLKMVIRLFRDETRDLLDTVHVEIRLLFGVYLAFMLVVFYSSIFLRTLKAARHEVAKAQEFASMVPLHVLDSDEAATVKAFYMRNNGMEEPDTHDENLDDDKEK